MEYDVTVTVENLPGIADPEGQTILDDLLLSGGVKSVTQVRTAKVLRFRVRARSAAAARKDVAGICERLRVYNPLVSAATIT